MTIYIEGHSFGYELQRVAKLFLFGERVTVEEGPPPDFGSGEYLYAARKDDTLRVEARLPFRPESVLSEMGDMFDAESPVRLHISDDAPPEHAEHALGVLLYRILSQVTGLRPEWGVLTGIRPVKLFVSDLRRGADEPALRKHFVDGCLLSEARYALGLETARAEQKILDRSTPDSFSLYVSIPFCPTRCAYCSFVSHSVEQAAKLIPDYVDRLCEELTFTAQTAARLGLRLRTVYFGGGTPTTLSAEQLTRVMGTISEQFDLSDVWEYTVEAGRPDTITQDKLRAIKAGGADRISINPQTLSDSVLRAIGRRHTAQETLDAFALARSCGFGNINMDLIAGLPTDTPESFRASVDGVLALSPENVTVHTLTVKRAANLSFEQARGELRTVSGMVDYARTAAANAGLRPYYLYRQTGSLSALENVGYAKPGYEGLYNVYIMDETHSILAVGAGASTKLRRPLTGELERIYNYKYPYEYISRFEEALTRKTRVEAFYKG